MHHVFGFDRRYSIYNLAQNYAGFFFFKVAVSLFYEVAEVSTVAQLQQQVVAGACFGSVIKCNHVFRPHVRHDCNFINQVGLIFLILIK